MSWWRHQIETFSALLALYEWNPPLTGGFPSQRPVRGTLIFFFDLCLNKRLSKQPRRRWFETPSRSPWRHYSDSRLKWCTISHHIVTQRSISSMTLTINTTRHISPTENRITNTEFKEWINNYITCAKLWDVISHACRYFNGELNHDYLEIVGRETTGI